VSIDPRLPVPSSKPHGFEDDPETRRLLRLRPGRRALSWVERTTGGRVLSTAALRGGNSSAVHAVSVLDRAGRRSTVVLRRYVREELNAEEPDMAAREARALEFVERAEIPTPTLLACDPGGGEVGEPAVLMTRLPGRVEWAPRDLDRWLDRLVTPLLAVHALDPPTRGFRPYAPYEQQSDEPPPWSSRRELWARAIEVARAPAPPGRAGYVHRDYHPGNVLWRRGVVTGVIDWQSASIGLPSVDVGHCRLNLCRYGLEVADDFTRRYEAASGLSYHPWGDVVAIVGVLDGLRESPGRTDVVLEEALDRALSELAPGGR
jgi:aminoglycoside phosphotransferase (APT) family kinase protein